MRAKVPAEVRACMGAGALCGRDAMWARARGRTHRALVSRGYGSAGGVVREQRMEALALACQMDTVCVPAPKMARQWNRKVCEAGRIRAHENPRLEALDCIAHCEGVTCARPHSILRYETRLSHCLITA